MSRIIDLDRRPVWDIKGELRKIAAGDGSAVVRSSGRDAPVIVKRLSRGLRNDKYLYSIVFDHPVDQGRTYPSMMIVLGATSHTTDPSTLDPTCAYIAFINALEPDWSGTDLVRLALSIATSAGMKRCRVQDAAVMNCPGKDKSVTFPLSSFLLLLKGITYYGRLGFSPVPEPSVFSLADTEEVNTRIREAHSRVGLATAGELRTFMSALFEHLSKIKKIVETKKIKFVQAYTAFGIRHRHEVPAERAMSAWSAAASGFRKNVVRALLSGSSDDDLIVDLLDAMCKCRSQFFQFIWFLGEEFNAIVVNDVEIEWPIHEDFLFLVGHVNNMILEKTLPRRPAKA